MGRGSGAANGKRASCHSASSKSTTTPRQVERKLRSTHTKPSWKRRNTHGRAVLRAPRRERVVVRKEREARRRTSVRALLSGPHAAENDESARASRETQWRTRSFADGPKRAGSA